MALFFGTRLAFSVENGPQPLSSLFPPLENGGSIVLGMPERSAIIFVGNINQESNKAIRKFIDNDVNVRNIYVNSGGGDLINAIEIADYLRNKKIRVIVAGRCFSACANYIFAGAISKVVLPGSLIGIHGKKFHYFGKNIISVDADKTDYLIKESGDLSVDLKIKKILLTESNFYKKIGISLDYYSAFDEYTKSIDVKSATGNSGEECRNISIWILRYSDMKKIGISGMESIWSPGNMEEAKNISKKFGFDSNQIFFGSISDISALCGQKETTEKIKRFLKF
ncbi:ATP-dependent Clp protease proteolytic subunit [Janthinobacterium sp. LB3P112]|uniref:ATP-dependent Clp protease proteolytic subunit n=1 Tax=Janthinobacterium sp. LB3P112 TaxID=3424196 RepID=UPI003F27D38F